MTACTTPVAAGMEVENDTAELNDLRISIVEMLFVSGNHFCPACEKSGNCELQALAYRFQMMVPRYPYIFPENKQIRILLNFILIVTVVSCKDVYVHKMKRQKYFAFRKEENVLEINIDHELAAK